MLRDTRGPEPHATPVTGPTSRLGRQLAFIAEIDRLKTVLRQTTTMDESRRENSAEHSWHLAVMAIVLAEYAPEGVDVLRTLKMLLVHDVVEIDAGDAFCYDADANLGKEERERLAAERLFGLLPEDIASELRDLWDEFEAGASGEARFAVALDRLQPLLQNYHTQGGTWRLHGVTDEQILRRMAPIEAGAPELWPVVARVVEEVCAAGYVGRAAGGSR